MTILLLFRSVLWYINLVLCCRVDSRHSGLDT